MVLEVVKECEALITRFLDGDLTIDEFQTAYLKKFKNEQRPLDEPSSSLSAANQI